MLGRRRPSQKRHPGTGARLCRRNCTFDGHWLARQWLDRLHSLCRREDPRGVGVAVLRPQPVPTPLNELLLARANARAVDELDRRKIARRIGGRFTHSLVRTVFERSNEIHRFDGAQRDLNGRARTELACHRKDSLLRLEFVDEPERQLSSDVMNDDGAGGTHSAQYTGSRPAV